MIDRLLFPEKFADILAHLWMNKVHRTARAVFFVCGAVREVVALVNGVIPDQFFCVRRRHELP